MKRFTFAEQKPQEWDMPHAWAYTYRGQLQVLPKAGATLPPEPPPAPAPFPPLVNAGFESGLDAWQPYRMDGPIQSLLYELRDLDAPGMDTLAVHTAPGYAGRKAVMLSGFSRCWRGGVWQTLVNVPIGARVKIGLWFITYGSDAPGVRNVKVEMNSLAGIGFDAQGLSDPNAGRIDWKLIEGGDTVGNIGGGRDPKWQYIEHECRTTTGALTVFLNSDLGALSLGRTNWPMSFTRAHFDDVLLEVLP